MTGTSATEEADGRLLATGWVTAMAPAHYAV